MQLSQHPCVDSLGHAADLFPERGEQPAHTRGLAYLGGGSVANGYEDGRLVMVFHVKCRGRDGKSKNFAAVYNAFGKLGKCEIVPWRQGITEGEVFLPAGAQVEQSVFVGVVEVSDKGKRRGVRSIVRLYPLDGCPHCAAQVLDPPSGFGKLFTGLGDRELPLGALGSLNPKLTDGNGIDEVVQGRPEVVDEISKDQRPSVEVGCESKSDRDGAGISFRVGIFGQDIRLGLFPRPDFSVEGFGVFICTPDFKIVA